MSINSACFTIDNSAYILPNSNDFIIFTNRPTQSGTGGQLVGNYVSMNNDSFTVFNMNFSMDAVASVGSTAQWKFTLVRAYPYQEIYGCTTEDGKVNFNICYTGMPYATFGIKCEKLSGSGNLSLKNNGSLISCALTIIELA